MFQDPPIHNNFTILNRCSYIHFFTFSDSPSCSFNQVDIKIYSSFLSGILVLTLTLSIGYPEERIHSILHFNLMDNSIIQIEIIWILPLLLLSLPSLFSLLQRLFNLYLNSWNWITHQEEKNRLSNYKIDFVYFFFALSSKYDLIFFFYSDFKRKTLSQHFLKAGAVSSLHIICTLCCVPYIAQQMQKEVEQEMVSVRWEIPEIVSTQAGQEV